MLHRYRCVWNGFEGAPGVTTFFFDYPSPPGATPNIVTALNTWTNALKPLLPAGVTLTPQVAYDILDPATGLLQDTQNDAGAPVNRGGEGSASYSASSGGCATLKTTAVVAGKRLRGRHFLVPLAAGAYTVGGGLAAATVTTIDNAYTALMSDTSLAPLSVWHRPVGGAGGVAAPVSTVVVNSRGAVLRSRRD